MEGASTTESTLAAERAVWPDDEFTRIAPYEAAKIGSLIADETAWIQRRVETVSFVDETTYSRHTSVHFDVPDFQSTPGTDPVALTWAPIALLKKDVLRNLDVRDEAGRALAVMSRKQNAQIGFEILRQQAGEVLGLKEQAELDARIVWIFGEVAGLPPPSDEPPEPTKNGAQQFQSLLDDETMLSYLSDLDRFFLLLARVDALAHQTRIVKFTYEQDFDPTYRYETGLRLIGFSFREPTRGLAMKLGLRDFQSGFSTPSMFDAQSYHVEMVCPDETSIAEAHLYRCEEPNTQAAASTASKETNHGKEPGDEEPASVSDDDHGSATVMELTQRELEELTTDIAVDSDYRTDRAHLYGQAPHPDSIHSYVTVASVLRAPVVAPVALLTVLTASVISGGLAVHFLVSSAGRTDTATSLIVAIPTFLAPFVVPGAHRVVRRMFVGLRAVAFLSALCSFLAAASLALKLKTQALAVIWSGLAGFATLLAVLACGALLHSWWRTNAPTSRTRGIIRTLLPLLLLAPSLDGLGDHSVGPHPAQWLFHAAGLACAAGAIIAAILWLWNQEKASVRPISD